MIWTPYVRPVTAIGLLLAFALALTAGAGIAQADPIVVPQPEDDDPWPVNPFPTLPELIALIESLMSWPTGQAGAVPTIESPC